MKKQLLLTIMVGYATLISVNLNAADFASLNPNDSPYFLTPSGFDNYVQQKALRTAGYTALLGKKILLITESGARASLTQGTFYHYIS